MKLEIFYLVIIVFQFESSHSFTSRAKIFEVHNIIDFFLRFADKNLGTFIAHVIMLSIIIFRNLVIIHKHDGISQENSDLYWLSDTCGNRLGLLHEINISWAYFYDLLMNFSEQYSRVSLLSYKPFIHSISRPPLF